MVGHQIAMKIRYNRDTLRELPPPGVQWRWSRVVNSPEHTGGVDASTANALANSDDNLIERRGDGWCETSRELAEYLDKMYGIDLSEPAGQSRLPVDAGPVKDSRLLADGSGSTGPVAGGKPRQVSLDGDDATDAVKAVKWREAEREHEAASKQPVSKIEKARSDASQSSITAFTGKMVGALRVPAGSTYPKANHPVAVDA